jgi:hypothetical protein
MRKRCTPLQLFLAVASFMSGRNGLTIVLCERDTQDGAGEALAGEGGKLTSSRTLPPITE